MDRLGWVEQSPHYVSFIDQSVETAARLVVTVRLIAPFELSKESKLIIGQVRHDGLQWFRPKVAHLVRQETAAQRGKDSASMTHVRGRDYSKLTRNIKRIPMRFRHVCSSDPWENLQRNKPGCFQASNNNQQVTGREAKAARPPLQTG